MKCKPGDLAIVISGDRSNVGLAVTVQRLEDPPPFNGAGAKHTGKIWKVDRDINWYIAGSPQCICARPYIEDSYLMPINPPSDMTEDTDAQKFIEKTY